MPRSGAGHLPMVRSATVGPLREGFVKVDIRSATFLTASFEEARIESGEDEKLITRSDLQVESHPPFGV